MRTTFPTMPKLDADSYSEQCRAHGATVISFDSGAAQLVIFQDERGRLHNGPGCRPAKVEWFESGELREVAWFEHGARCSGPVGGSSLLRWFETGQIEMDAHYRGELLVAAADGGPSMRVWFPDGQLRMSSYSVDGRLAQGEGCGPAMRMWWPNGVARVVGWVDDDGELHDPMPGVPAWTERDEHNQIVGQGYFCHGARR